MPGYLVDAYIIEWHCITEEDKVDHGRIFSVWNYMDYLLLTLEMKYRGCPVLNFCVLEVNFLVINQLGLDIPIV